MNKKNLPLILALALPLLMIVAIAISIYAPGVGKQPKINFVYATGNGVYGNYQYIVRDGMVQQLEIPQPQVYPPTIKQTPAPTANFYIYNVESNTASPISFDAAQKLHLDPGNKSSDGFTVERGNGGGGLFGSSGDYNSWYIKGFNRSWKLNLKLEGDPNYYNSFQFIGWIE